MKLFRRHKYILVALAVYWPLVFILTHIPVPALARKSGMSDKTMHVMAYFALTFLVWCAVNPYGRAEWFRAKTWWVIAAVAFYGVADEFFQRFIGRSMDFHDWIADLFGILFAMGILSIFEFWSALLITAMASIFIISNLSNLTALYPHYHLNTLFHFSAYAGLSLIWIQYLDRHVPLGRRRAVWLLAAAGLPLALLGGVMMTASYFHKSVWWTEAATAVFGIAATVLICRVTFGLTGRFRRPQDTGPKNS